MPVTLSKRFELQLELQVGLKMEVEFPFKPGYSFKPEASSRPTIILLVAPLLEEAAQFVLAIPTHREASGSR